MKTVRIRHISVGSVGVTVSDARICTVRKLSTGKWRQGLIESSESHGIRVY